jgi:membrane protease subunit HflC
MRLFILSAALLLVAILARMSFFTVDATEFVYVTQFGKPVVTLDGTVADEAGLHVKWPWPIQSVQRLDRRLQTFDLPERELLTNDPKGRTIDRTLTIDAYVCWRIADKAGVDRFIKTVGTAERARSILGQRIGSDLGAAIGHMELDDLLSKEPGRVDRQREQLREKLLASWKKDSRQQDDYGLEVVDIRLRRTTHPPQVRQAIFNRIISERNKKVADYESDGDKQAADIASDTERKKRELLDNAHAQAQRIKGEADTEADRIRNVAHAKDPEFYTFLKKLESYQRILGDNKSMLLLSTHRDLFDVLFQPPKPKNNKPGEK